MQYQVPRRINKTLWDFWLQLSLDYFPLSPPCSPFWTGMLWKSVYTCQLRMPGIPQSLTFIYSQNTQAPLSTASPFTFCRCWMLLTVSGWNSSLSVRQSFQYKIITISSTTATGTATPTIIQRLLFCVSAVDSFSFSTAVKLKGRQQYYLVMF